MGSAKEQAKGVANEVEGKSQAKLGDAKKVEGDAKK